METTHKSAQDADSKSTEVGNILMGKTVLTLLVPDSHLIIAKELTWKLLPSLNTKVCQMGRFTSFIQS